MQKRKAKAKAAATPNSDNQSQVEDEDEEGPQEFDHDSEEDTLQMEVVDTEKGLAGVRGRLLFHDVPKKISSVMCKAMHADMIHSHPSFHHAIDQCLRFIWFGHCFIGGQDMDAYSESISQLSLDLIKELCKLQCCNVALIYVSFCLFSSRHHLSCNVVKLC